MNDRATDSAKTAGFSLIEMLVVLAIVSAVAGLAATSLPVRKEKRPLTMIEQLSEKLIALRYRALNTGRAQTAKFDVAGRAFFQPSGDKITFPKTWDLSVTIGRLKSEPGSVPTITFLPDGTSSGVDVTLRDADGHSASVRVNWLTGLVESSDHAF